MSVEKFTLSGNAGPTRRQKRLAYERCYYDACKDKILEKNKRYRDRNKERLAERARERAAKNKVNIRAQKLKYHYGLTLEKYHDLVILCKGMCPVCKRPWGTSHSEKPNVDHCHKTGVVRGVICNRCNLVLGKTGDDPVLLRSLADYLESKQVV
jgi:hypothetical protein